MSDTEALERGAYLATDGEIAVVNLEGSRRRSWSRLARDPMSAGVAERIVEEEQMVLQFLGNAGALGRLEALALQLGQLDPTSARTALIGAQVASATHRFADARTCLVEAERAGASREEVERLSLTINQACGTNLDAVLVARRRLAAESDNLHDLIPLGALLADRRAFAEADCVYRRALRVYQDVSPFALAWGCFQLGVLWGELVPEPQTSRAADWYRLAIEYVPVYAKARVHLAEIHLRGDDPVAAERLLAPAVSSGDPEVCWRLSDAMVAQGRFGEAEVQLAAARSGFEELLDRHLLAFADHGAEFYAGSGNEIHRALDLACANVANRPTLRAFEQAHAIALDADERSAATELLGEATQRWGSTDAFHASPLAGTRAASTPNGGAP